MLRYSELDPDIRIALGGNKFMLVCMEGIPILRAGGAALKDTCHK